MTTRITDTQGGGGGNNLDDLQRLRNLANNRYNELLQDGALPPLGDLQSEAQRRARFVDRVVDYAFQDATTLAQGQVGFAEAESLLPHLDANHEWVQYANQTTPIQKDLAATIQHTYNKAVEMGRIVDTPENRADFEQSVYDWASKESPNLGDLALEGLGADVEGAFQRLSGISIGLDHLQLLPSAVFRDDPWITKTRTQHNDRQDESRLIRRIDEADAYVVDMRDRFDEAYQANVLVPLDERIKNPTAHGLTGEQVDEMVELLGELARAKETLGDHYMTVLRDSNPEAFLPTEDAQIARADKHNVAPVQYILDHAETIITVATGIPLQEQIGTPTFDSIEVITETAVANKKVAAKRDDAERNTVQYFQQMAQRLEVMVGEAEFAKQGDRATALSSILSNLRSHNWGEIAGKQALDPQYSSDGYFSGVKFVSSVLAGALGGPNVLVEAGGAFEGAPVNLDNLSITLNNFDRTPTAGEVEGAKVETEHAAAVAEQAAADAEVAEREAALTGEKGNRLDTGLARYRQALEGESALARYEEDDAYANKIEDFLDKLNSGNLGVGEGEEFKGLEEIYEETGHLYNSVDEFLLANFRRPEFEYPVEEPIDDLLAADRQRQVSGAQFSQFALDEAARLNAEAERVAGTNPQQSEALAKQAQDIITNIDTIAADFSLTGGVGPVAQARFFNAEVLEEENQGLSFSNPFRTGGALNEDQIGDARTFVGSGLVYDESGNLLRSTFDPNTGEFLSPEQQVNPDTSPDAEINRVASFNLAQGLISSGSAVREALYSQFTDPSTPYDDPRNVARRNHVDFAIGESRPGARESGSYDYDAVSKVANDRLAIANAETQNAHNRFLGETRALQAQSQVRQQEKAKREQQQARTQGATTTQRRRQNRP